MGCTKECHGADTSAATSSAAQKCSTVGVLKVAIPSCERLTRSELRTRVMTTNISPVNAAADEPTMT